ncbi:MAG: hypothetical protein GY894_10190 [Planctomycetes bacterium]|jgi:hypothetical protein|nr:hypothetical protein [Planctomycetota bacterium]MCP4839710.1 hypothetical protein [Planctomycetota bacterium]
MIATGIFILLFLTLLAMRSKRRWPAVVLFLISMAAIVFLLAHHATDQLNLSF